MSNTKNSKQLKTIAVLGTGIIGAPVARNLQKDLFAVRVWNRTRAKAEALALCGVDVFDTPREAVDGADIIITLLKDGPVVLDAMESAAPGLSKGAIWIQMSTVGITAIDDLAAFAKRRELKFYDAPLQGTRQPAEQGQLVILASGPTEERDNVQPIFDAIGKRTIWVSDRIGASSRLKLALNSWAFALTHGVAESLAIAKGLGIDPALVVDVVKGGPMDSGYFQLKASSILADDYTTSFSIANAVKDAQLVVEAAEQAGIQVDATVAGLQRFLRALEAGHGDKDMAASGLVRVER
ncbi:NAD(P)-dependent oxidoreductase [Paenibacillus profundus]|uniref:NAD(P)-dependent oxidoreductase n=1 Tax=Paenibacillus profundus TaxID=1173085 RepID=A0ABS8YJ43_9BACL|nr:NAD(P)-dependent oxidoreductase [Paenibacillus profundus]MCE5171806.1 NAD(P)-dependent oxidoreductase [Paenibacillus profundus]